MIYFVQAVGGGPVKIGFSDDVPTRIKELESHYGHRLAILATMPGGRDVEREMHGRFASARLGRTEQFRPIAEIMDFIGRPLLVDPDPDAVEAMEPNRRMTSLSLGPVTVALIKAIAASSEFRVTQSDVIRLAVLKLANERLPFDQVDAIVNGK